MTESDLRIGINLAGLEHLVGGDLKRMVEFAVRVEELGFHRIVVSDHVVMGSVDGYPFKEFPVPLDYPFLDPLIYLATIAGATKRVRLTSGILIAPLRPAAVLAKMAATLDVISDGRLDLGVGSGWQQSEFDAVGVDFEARGQIFDDTMRHAEHSRATVPRRFAQSMSTLMRSTACRRRDRRAGCQSGSPVRQTVGRLVV